jgi:hypothetical protein
LISKRILAFLHLELISREIVREIDDFELARVDVEDCAHEDVFELQGVVLATFEEDAFVLDVVLRGVGVTI